GVILVEHQDVDAAQRQIDRGGQSHRARTRDDYRPVPRRGGELGRLTVRIDRWCVGLHDYCDSGRLGRSWFDRPTTNGFHVPFVLSLSKDERKEANPRALARAPCRAAPSTPAD